MRKTLSVVLFLFFLTILRSGTEAVAATYGECSPDQLHQALDMPVFTSWNSFYEAYRSYGGCNDGAPAEGWSDSAAQLLAKHWNQISDFAQLAEKDADFRTFILDHHIDSTADDTDLKSAIAHAKQDCPAGLNDLCGLIAAKAHTALKEAGQE